MKKWLLNCLNFIRYDYDLCQEAVNFFLLHSDYNEDNLKKAHFYQDKIKKLLGRQDVRNIL